MVYVNKQPLSLRKTASKNSTKKLQQQLSSHSQGGSSGGGTYLSPGPAGTSRPSSRYASRSGSRVNSDDEDDDYGSGFEQWEAVGYGSEREDDGGRRGRGEGSVESRILDAIEQLGEKRSSTREEALTKLVAILSQHFVAELLDSHKEDLMDLLKKSIKRGGTRECVLAANVITLIFITAGEDDEQVLTDMAPLLKYTITNHDQPEVKAACLYTLATACYISSTPQPSHLPTYEMLNYLADLVVPKDSHSSSSSAAAIHSGTLVAALESFGLLFAALFGRNSTSNNDDDSDRSSGDEPGTRSQHEKDAQQARRLFSKMIPAIHYTLLEYPSVEVRVASGEVVGLMFEVLDHHEQQRRRHEEEGYKTYHQQEGTEWSRRGRETYQDDDDDEDDWDDDGGGGIASTTTSPFWYRDRQDLVDVLANLATDSNRHRSRKDRCAGRSAFRDIIKSVDLGQGEDCEDSGSGDQEKPQESLKLKDYIVDFYGWVEILQLRYLRDRLTSGLQTHLFHNPTIHSLLPSTAILYSPFDFSFSSTASGAGKGHGSGGGGSRVGSRIGSRTGSRASSRAGSRPPSSMGHYSDTGEDFVVIDQAYLLQQQQLQLQASSRVDRKYQNAEVARLRHVQRKKDRGGSGGGGGGGGKFFHELEY
ncbi:Interferon- developmental regulator 1 [Linnemannia schmuckeri]|uniref:Interferon- developmental regulator 1 n=1 Tax=Linnemannia schmuckeri TaxID=64567 RepID=A0A9P5S2B2_9FUNG|nr:Interferon- developmental regulator 1 [Linnemannia schmuckeri]